MTSWPTDPDDNGNAQPKTLNGHTKFVTRKTWHVVVRNDPNPQELLDYLLARFGPGGDKPGSKKITDGEVRDNVLTMTVVYTVRGGYPSDLTRWISRIAKIDPQHVTAEQVGDPVVTDWT
ncbi:hypothetical protein [Branchiibius sp. NY16-3462-2]|uniref:hypothetical protein n=1 Tax=Branchiibius sp. NY16-3462-2 TaxID=1807500 RepID=UPI00079689E2|nr:hypothetical protein [Branchiibius sp. NY16-3462-2]KYH43240.1 hypothetical protein AZH51_12865 [Branchiibius sp. NY16-3462-2]